MTHREQAEELRLALMMGLIEKGDVIRWADALIAAEAELPGWVFDLSLAANESTDAVTARLRDAVDVSDVTLPTRRALERLVLAYRSGRLAPRDVADKIVLWANSARIPDETRTEAYVLSFIVEDVREGRSPGSAADLTRAVDWFLELYDATARAQPAGRRRDE